MIANGNGKYGGIGANADVVANFCGAPEFTVAPGWAATCKEIVYKHCAMGNKAIIAYGDKFADKCVRLDFALFANDYASLDFDKWTNKGSTANNTTVKIDRLDDSYIFTKGDINNSCVANFWFRHSGL